MTAVSLLGFVGILAIASMSEARFCRSSLPHDPEGPRICYTLRTPEAIRSRVTHDLTYGYVVWSKVSDERLEQMVESLRGMLRIIPGTIVDPLFIIRMTDVTIPKLEVPHRHFIVNDINLIRESSSTLLLLKIVVPKVVVTFSSPTCQITERPLRPCRVSYKFEDVRVTLKAKWQDDPQLRRISHAEILDCKPDSIKAILRVENGQTAEISASEDEPVWETVIAKMKSHIPDRNPNYQELVRTFARRVFL